MLRADMVKLEGGARLRRCTVDINPLSALPTAFLPQATRAGRAAARARTRGQREMEEILTTPAQPSKTEYIGHKKFPNDDDIDYLLESSDDPDNDDINFSLKSSEGSNFPHVVQATVPLLESVLSLETLQLSHGAMSPHRVPPPSRDERRNIEGRIQEEMAELKVRETEALLVNELAQREEPTAIMEINQKVLAASVISTEVKLQQSKELVDKMEGQVRELTTRMEELAEDNRVMEASVVNSDTELQLKKDQGAKMEEQLRELTNRMEEMAEDKRVLEASVKGRDAKLQLKKIQGAKMEEQLGKLTARVEEMAEDKVVLEASIIRSNADLQQKDEQRAKMYEYLGKLTARSEKLSEDKRLLVASVVSWDVDLQQKKEHGVKMKKQLGELTARVKKMAEDKKVLEASCIRRDVELQQKKEHGAEMEKQLGELTARVKEMAEDKWAMAASVISRDAELQQKKEQEAKMGEQMVELTARVEKMSADNRVLAASVISREVELQQKKEQGAKMAKQFGELTASVEIMAEDKRVLAAKVISRDIELQQMKEQAVNMEELLVKLTASVEEMAEDKTVLADNVISRDVELQQNKVQAAKMEEQLCKLNMLMVPLRNEIEEKTVLLLESKQDVERKKREINELKQRISKYDENFAQQQIEIGEEWEEIFARKMYMQSMEEKAPQKNTDDKTKDTVKRKQKSKGQSEHNKKARLEKDSGREHSEEMTIVSENPIVNKEAVPEAERIKHSPTTPETSPYSIPIQGMYSMPLLISSPTPQAQAPPPPYPNPSSFLRFRDLGILTYPQSSNSDSLKADIHESGGNLENSEMEAIIKLKSEVASTVRRLLGKFNHINQPKLYLKDGWEIFDKKDFKDICQRQTNKSHKEVIERWRQQGDGPESLCVRQEDVTRMKKEVDLFFKIRKELSLQLEKVSLFSSRKPLYQQEMQSVASQLFTCLEASSTAELNLRGMLDKVDFYFGIRKEVTRYLESYLQELDPQVQVRSWSEHFCGMFLESRHIMEPRNRPEVTDHMRLIIRDTFSRTGGKI